MSCTMSSAHTSESYGSDSSLLLSTGSCSYNLVILEGSCIRPNAGETVSGTDQLTPQLTYIQVATPISEIGIPVKRALPLPQSATHLAWGSGG